MQRTGASSNRESEKRAATRQHAIQCYFPAVFFHGTSRMNGTSIYSKFKAGCCAAVSTKQRHENQKASYQYQGGGEAMAEGGARRRYGMLARMRGCCGNTPQQSRVILLSKWLFYKTGLPFHLRTPSTLPPPSSPPPPSLFTFPGTTSDNLESQEQGKPSLAPPSPGPHPQRHRLTLSPWPQVLRVASHLYTERERERERERKGRDGGGAGREVEGKKEEGRPAPQAQTDISAHAASTPTVLSCRMNTKKIQSKTQITSLTIAKRYAKGGRTHSRK